MFRKSSEGVRHILRFASENVRLLDCFDLLIYADIGKCLYPDVTACSVVEQ